MGDENHPSTTITWRITGFTTLTGGVYSDMFLVGGSKWKILIYPKGNKTDHLSMYLYVAELETLPFGWKREVKCSFTVVNQHDNNLSRKKGIEKTFASHVTNWGYPEFISLSELRDISRGFLVDDTLVVEAKVEVSSIHPPIASTGTLGVRDATVATSTNRFDTYFASLEGFITSTSSITREISVTQEDVINHGIPSLEEVEQAKQSLKECLTDPYKLNMKERLAKALLTLSLSKDVLSPDQQQVVVLFWKNFDEYTSDFLTFEQENSEYELQKIMKDRIVWAMEKNHQAHLSFKQSHIELSKEEEELEKRLKDIRFKKSKLMVDWNSLLAESGKLMSNYKAQEKKVSDAEEKKRIAKERMSNSTTAWANLKEHFG